MDAYELVISVFALNKRYGNAIQKTGMDHDFLAEKIMSKYPHAVLRQVGIRKHKFHRDSLTLENAFNELISTRVLCVEIPGDKFRWKFPITPEQYFQEKIKPQLDKQKLGRLEEFAMSLDGYNCHS